jgi:DNA (cytosine-5)-methyltransferase 1
VEGGKSLLTVGSLFAGIGGFDLGFERAGYDIRWQVEINAYCRAVLRKHWPDARRYGDVRRVGAHNLEAVDVICGGFPCQDISVAGAGAGLEGARSGLWSEYRRVIRELRPRYVVVENVSALLGRGLGTVLGDLAACGYDAEWDCIPASAVGAPHRRDRVWIVAYANGPGLQGRHSAILRERASERAIGPSGAFVADADHKSKSRGTFDDGARIGLQAFTRAHEWWRTEPDVGRVAHGVPARVDRLRGLGNAIVPQIATWIAERIKEADAMRAA